MAKFRPTSRTADHQKLKDVLQKMLEAYKIKGKLNQSRIKPLWNRLMGPSIAQHTSEIKVYRQKLYVSINSAALRQELSMGREKICNLINKELGEEYLKEVIIR